MLYLVYSFKDKKDYLRGSKDIQVETVFRDVDFVEVDGINLVVYEQYYTLGMI
jgi:hypothetical protein